MVKFYGISTTKDKYYDFKNPLEIKASELENLKDILSPYIPAEERSKIPKISTELVNGVLRPVGYRVVKKDGLTSLGLLRNPNILTYPIKKWYSLPKDWVEPGPQDWGGISIARTEGKAKWMQQYMLDKHNIETRVFRTAFTDIIHHKEWRMKASKILMFEEMFFKK